MNDYHSPELLSPAGGYEQFLAAVENGADAVYLGGKLHNARQNAANFDDETLIRALEYAHARGVSVHITLNTLIAPNEWAETLRYAVHLYVLGTDALIVQDLGLARVLHALLPDLALHLSTQGTVCDANYAALAAGMGFSRVILARETELKDIKEIAAVSPLPVEVFVHGAMCISVSGQCLFSSMVGGRSGNRGKCAQPCRLPYTLLKDGVPQASGYLLSPKDNCAIEYLDALRRAGVASLKIEGRMKSPEYVAAVVHVYRKYLDEPGQLQDEDYKTLLQAFNRGGFAPGYLNGWAGRDFICRERPKHWGVPIGTVLSADPRRNLVQVLLSDSLALGDGVELDCPDFPGNIVTVIFQNGVPQSSAGAGDVVTIGNLHNARSGVTLYKISDKQQEEWARRSYARFYRRVPLKGRFTVRLGEPADLTVWDADGHSVTKRGTRPAEQARRRALTPEDVRSQLAKTGETPFTLRDCDVDLPDGLALPVSELNSLRRQALEELLDIRSHRYPHRHECTVPAADYPAQPSAAASLTAFFYEINAATLAAAAAARRVCLPFLLAILPENLELVRGMDFSGRELVFWLPPETPPALPAQLTQYASALRRAGYTAALIGNLGQLTPLLEAGWTIYGDTGLNIFNSAAVEQMADFGLRGVTLSPELTLRQIQSIYHGDLSAEAAVYGRLPLMYSKHCPIGAEMGGGARCGLCKTGNFALEDRKGMWFPLQCYSGICRSMILNAVKLHVPDFAARLSQSGVDHLRLYFAEESPAQIRDLLSQYTRAQLSPPDHFVRGKEYTAGHYLRGV